MVEKAKYPAQNLTEEDKKIIDQVVFKFAVYFYSLTRKYLNPKEYAEKVVLKSLQSNKGIAALHAIAIARNETPDHVFKPGEINEKLTKGLADFTIEDAPNKYLHPRDMREVLKGLENEGIFLNITGKKEIRDAQHGRPHPGKKPPSDEVHNDRGGKPSAYKVTEEFVKLKKTMEKPEAIDLVRKKLIESGLSYKLHEFNILAFLHAAKMDQTVLPKIVKWGKAFTQDDLREAENESFEELQLLDDNQLKQFAAKGAEALIEDSDYHKFFSMAGLFKL